MYQVVLNHDWEWATIEQKICYFTPHQKLADAEWEAQDMLVRGTARVSQLGLACQISINGKSNASIVTCLAKK